MSRSPVGNMTYDLSIQRHQFLGFVDAELGHRMALRLHGQPVADGDGFIEQVQQDRHALAAALDDGEARTQFDHLLGRGEARRAVAGIRRGAAPN